MNPVNPDNEPKLPSFKSQQKKEDKKGGALPSGAGKEMPSFLKSFPKGTAPMMRVRGFGGGASLVERLKSLRKKDLAFIAAGLSVLVMAPLAEHFLMSPEDQAGQLQKGFSSNSAFPGDVGSIYDPGAGGFSPGGLLGQGSDVITPLNVRDPSALIMGPGATQKPSATVEAPPPPKADSSSWKDALTSAAQKGAGAATRKASLPMPHPKLAAGMRGLGAVGGGGGGSYSLPALNAGNVPNRAGGSNSLMKVQSAPGFRGAASRASQAGGGSEAMKAGGARQGDMMNRGGAGAALDNAAKEAIPGGKGFGGGGPGAGDETKAPGYAKPDHNKNLGESLAYLKQKMEMEKALDLKWKKKAWYEFERQKMIEESIIKSAIENLLGKGLFEPMGKAMADLFGNLTGSAGPAGYMCFKAGQKPFTLSADEYKKRKTDLEMNGFTCGAYGKPDSGGGEETPGSKTDSSVNQVGPVGPDGSTGQTNYANSVLGKNWGERNGQYDSSLNGLSNSISGLNSSDPALKALQGKLQSAKADLDNASASMSKAKGFNTEGLTGLASANQNLGQVRAKHKEYGINENKSVNGAGTAVLNLSHLSQAGEGDKKFGFIKDAKALDEAVKQMQEGSAEADKAESQSALLESAKSTARTAQGKYGAAMKSYEAAEPLAARAITAKEKLIEDYNAGAGGIKIEPASPIVKSFADANEKFGMAKTQGRIALEGTRNALVKTNLAIKEGNAADGLLVGDGKTATGSKSEVVTKTQEAVEKVRALQEEHKTAGPVAKDYSADIDKLTPNDVAGLKDSKGNPITPDKVKTLTDYVTNRDNAKTAIETAQAAYTKADETNKKVTKANNTAEEAYSSKEKGSNGLAEAAAAN